MSWRFAAAVAAGTSHVREGLPCQDSLAAAVVDTGGSRALVAVVADGAGSASHGGEGSAFVCADLLQRLSTDLPALDGAGSADWLRDRVVGTREALLAHAGATGLPPRQFASTLLCSVVSDAWAVFAQVGDGAIVVSEPGTGEWSWLFWPQRGEYANTTSFVTDAHAEQALEVEAVAAGITDLAMFTDGLQHLVLDYSQQVVHSPFFEKMLPPVRGSRADGEDPALSAGLLAYLGTPAVTSRADDDLTLLLATCSQDGQDRAAPA